MNKNIKDRKKQSKKLEQDTKKMEEELERIRKFKAMELEKQKLRQQLAELEKQKIENQRQMGVQPVPKGYNDKLKKQTEEEVRKRIENMIIYQTNNKINENEDKNDSQNLKYFLNVMACSQYYDALVANKITTLAKLRQIDTEGAKKVGIPLKDMIKINKKLRDMGY